MKNRSIGTTGSIFKGIALIFRNATKNEGGALRGALLPVTVFLAVKVTGGTGLALWDRALVGARGFARPSLLVLAVHVGDRRTEGS